MLFSIFYLSDCETEVSVSHLVCAWDVLKRLVYKTQNVCTYIHVKNSKFLGFHVSRPHNRAIGI